MTAYDSNFEITGLDAQLTNAGLSYLRTAKTLGITFTSGVLATGDEVIGQRLFACAATDVQ